MRTTALALPSLLLVACSFEAADPHDPFRPTEPPPAPVPPLVAIPGGPVLGPAPLAVSAIHVGVLAAEGRAPVVAVTADRSLHFALIDPASEWPAIARMGSDPVALPGARAPSHAVALAASTDGLLHVVWEAGGSVRYVRRFADGRMDAPLVLDAGDGVARDPTIAIASDGTIVVAHTRDLGPPGGEAPIGDVVVTHGETVAGTVVFGSPMVMSSGCCVHDVGGAAQRLSGPTLALGADGSAHVVYEWGTFANTTIDYVHDVAGVPSAPVRISEVAYVPCPSIVVDDAGTAHISFLTTWDMDVFYVTVRDGTPSERRAIFTPETGRPTMAMMHRDPSGRLHLGVTVEAERSRLSHVIADPSGGAEETVVYDAERGSVVELTPRAGGFVVSPTGALLFAFETADTWDAPRTARYASVQ